MAIYSIKVVNQTYLNPVQEYMGNRYIQDMQMENAGKV